MPKKVLKSNSKLPVICACRFLRFYRRFACHPDEQDPEREEKKITKKVKAAQRRKGIFRRVKLCINMWHIVYIYMRKKVAIRYN